MRPSTATGCAHSTPRRSTLYRPLPDLRAYWFCLPPSTGAEAADAIDEELDAFMHLWTVNRGVLLAPFHNMSLFSAFHTTDDVDRHTEVFAGAVEALLG